mmetsp:Transcript_89517/g.286943  ORF Transcript_89517/g.286943 Transcript_89517/m.286943 type:complete len:515 (-) Transcript_89517:56-1600(-)
MLKLSLKTLRSRPAPRSLVGMPIAAATAAAKAVLALAGLASAHSHVVGAAAPPGSTPQGPSSAFVHLFEWSWSDIAQECEQWLGPKGFTAVQISPPNDHIQGSQWWTRYQPVTYTLVSRSGDEAAFRDMAQRCNNVGVGIYADAVFNHIAAGGGTSIAGNSYGNRATPIYSAEDMHHNGGDDSHNCGVGNYSDKHNVQFCDLVGLPDLCTSCQKVQDTVVGYISNMKDIGIAGIRIDAAKHQDAGELNGIVSRVKDNLFVFQEVISGGSEAVTTSMYTSIGDVTEFNYPRQLAPNFLLDGKLQYFGNFGEAWGFMKSGDAVVFLDNQDTQRGEATLTYKNGKLYELANVFMLAHPYGYPKVMSSYDFNDHDQGPPSTPVHSGGNVNCNGQPSSSIGGWVCEHRWTAVANMVAWRRSAGSAGVAHFQAPGGDTIAFCRGSAACVALNRMSNTWNARVTFGVPPGKYCDVIRSDDPASCPTIEVGADGSAAVQVPPLGAVAVHIGRQVAAAMVLAV